MSFVFPSYGVLWDFFWQTENLIFMFNGDLFWYRSHLHILSKIFIILGQINPDLSASIYSVMKQAALARVSPPFKPTLFWLATPRTQKV